jgi:hypothetical protein
MALQTDENGFPMEGSSKWGTLTTVTLEANTAKEIVAANSRNNALIINNTTGADLFLSFGSSTNLSATVYTAKVISGQIVNINGATAQAGVFGFSVGGGTVCYQVGQ